MSMIRVENITFSYPSSFDPVFENVSFQIDTEWKRKDFYSYLLCKS